MICLNCGKKIPAGNISCIYCHAQINMTKEINVDIDIVEDSELLAEYRNKNHPDANKTDNKKTKKGNIKLYAIVALAIILFIAAGAGYTYYINSSAHILKSADSCYEKEDYKNALILYEKVIKRDSQDNLYYRAQIGAGNCHRIDKEYDKSEECFLKALDTKGLPMKLYTQAYSGLLELYSETDRQQDIFDTKDIYAVNKKLLSIYDKFSIEIPEFSVKGGREYTEDILLSLYSKSDLDIYYTDNGESPADGHGRLYQDEIELTEGETKIRACCYKNGSFGAVAEETYLISYELPDYPIVSPMNGTFYEDTLIHISANSGGDIYYTWDGSVPTRESLKYTEPIPVPVGNNELSVVVIDKNGKAGEVLRCSYTYINQ